MFILTYFKSLHLEMGTMLSDQKALLSKKICCSKIPIKNKGYKRKHRKLLDSNCFKLVLPFYIFIHFSYKSFFNLVYLTGIHSLELHTVLYTDSELFLQSQ